MGKMGRWYKKLYFAFASSAQVIKYWRKEGMRIGKGCSINKNADVIAEPYLVSLGDHVRITSGVKFITHDGGALLPDE